MRKRSTARSEKENNAVNEKLFTWEQDELKSKKLPNLVVLAYMIIVAVCVFTSWLRAQLPSALTADAESSDFRSYNALKHLENCTRDYHPWSSKYNIEVGKYIVNQLVTYKDVAEANGFVLDIEVQDKQMDPSEGAKYFKESGVVAAEVFRKVEEYHPYKFFLEPRNIIARLSKKTDETSKKEKKPALLITAHFDSGSTSYGAFDDGIGFVSMLETLRAMMYSGKDQEWNGDIIFMFGDGEEAGLLDAYGFLEHSSIYDVFAFLNLEAGGNGKRAMLFRFSDVRLKKIYADAAPYPHMDVIGSDIFKLGLIPSDTNFRLLVNNDKKNLSGIDVAFYEGRYKYHTPKDSFVDVDPKAVQALGSNVLAFTKAVLNSDYLEKRSKESETEYSEHAKKFYILFDVASKFVVSFGFNAYVAVSVTSLAATLFIVSNKLISSQRSFRFAVIREYICLVLWVLLTFGSSVTVGIVSRKYNGSFVGTFPSSVGLFTVVSAHFILFGLQYLFPVNKNLSIADKVLARKLSLLLFHVPLLALNLFLLNKYSFGTMYLFVVWNFFLMADILLPRVVSFVGSEEIMLLQFLVRTVVPLVLTYEVYESLLRALAPSVLDGASPVVVFGFIALALLIIIVSLYPELATIKECKWPLRAGCFLVTMLLLQMLLSFPYSLDKSFRLRPYFEADYTNPNSSTVTGAFLSGQDVGFALKVSSLFSDNASGKYDVYFDDIECSRMALMTVPDTGRKTSLEKCSVKFHNLDLLPNLDISTMTVKVARNGGHIEGQVQAPKGIYSCEVIQNFGQDFSGSFTSNITEYNKGIEVKNAKVGELLLLRRDAHEYWNFGFETKVEGDFDKVEVTFRCFVDDFATHVPFMAKMLKSLPNWATIFTAGERSVGFLKKVSA
ncbi:hypothetical protein MP638_002624 [Amoeboaphelidium occidentale]|nr:hypothetical protein MP638_002624 [Amoeboaphelidium occidentale]